MEASKLVVVEPVPAAMIRKPRDDFEVSSAGMSHVYRELDGGEQTLFFTEANCS